MEGVPTFDPDYALYLSLGMLGLALLMGVPMWFRNALVRRGARIPVTEGDIYWQTIARWLALAGTVGIASSVLLMSSLALPFAAFMVLCIALGCAGIFSAYCIDLARARRH